MNASARAAALDRADGLLRLARVRVCTVAALLVEEHASRGVGGARFAELLRELDREVAREKVAGEAVDAAVDAVTAADAGAAVVVAAVNAVISCGKPDPFAQRDAPSAGDGSDGLNLGSPDGGR